MNTPDDKPLTGRMRADKRPVGIEDYEQAGGYQGLRRALTMSPQEVRNEVANANLLGRGGGGFATGQKWSGVPMGPEASRPVYVVCNADEMEPGSFKDRLLMECDPHQLIEGLLIAAYAVESTCTYIFLRWAYHPSAASLRRAMDEARQRGYLGAHVLGSSWSVEMHLHVSAGRYMCGEAEGLMNAIEGKRAIPRSKPPRAVEVGLWGQPTVVNNVETLCCVSHILRNGAAWFLGLGRDGEGGTKLYGASGRVQRPGLWERPLGSTLDEILNDCAGGMQPGYTFRGVLPGGASSGFLVQEHMSLPLGFAAVAKAGSRLGTGTLIVMDDRICPVGVLYSLQQFFARESCGYCTPCREGLRWVADTLRAMEDGQGQPEDMEILQDHVRMVRSHYTFCELAPGAMESLKSALKYFRDDLEQHIHERRCPWR